MNQPEKGVNQYSETGCDEITRSSRGTKSAYLTARIARDHPYILKAPAWKIELPLGSKDDLLAIGRVKHAETSGPKTSVTR
jgi:hypothetical protein